MSGLALKSSSSSTVSSWRLWTSSGPSCRCSSDKQIAWVWSDSKELEIVVDWIEPEKFRYKALKTIFWTGLSQRENMHKIPCIRYIYTITVHEFRKDKGTFIARELQPDRPRRELFMNQRCNRLGLDYSGSNCVKGLSWQVLQSVKFLARALLNVWIFCRRNSLSQDTARSEILHIWNEVLYFLHILV